MITEAKKVLTIPVIASINCSTAQEWAFFAKKVEDAGADAIELNVFVLPTNLTQTSADNETMYFDIVSRVSSKIRIPISLKISPYFSNLGAVIRDLSFSEINGLVLFNKFYSPDVDINEQRITGSDVLSKDTDYKLTLRWIALMANRVNSDLSASTGIHDWETIVKMLLVGATTVQIVSILYKEGFSIVGTILQDISKWMEQNGYQSIADFRGKLSLDNTTNLAEFERVQFMRTFGEHK